MKKEQIIEELKSENGAYGKLRKRLLEYMKRVGYSFADIKRLTNSESNTVYDFFEGRCLPTYEFMLMIANGTKTPINYFISDNVLPQAEYKYRKLFKGISDIQKIKILINTEYFKNGKLDFYDGKSLNKVFEYRAGGRNIGYLIRTQRLMRVEKFKNMSELLYYSEKSFKNIESDNAGIHISALILLCETWKVPLDYFMMGELENKSYVINYLIDNIFKDLPDEKQEILIRYITSQVDWHKI